MIIELGRAVWHDFNCWFDFNFMPKKSKKGVIMANKAKKGKLVKFTTSEGICKQQH
jgi:hypothetical protein